MIWAIEQEFHKDLLAYIARLEEKEKEEREANGGKSTLGDYLHKSILKKFCSGEYVMTDLCRQGNKLFVEYRLACEVNKEEGNAST